MKEIRIFMEGGGAGAGGKATIRRGMDGFLGLLKHAARMAGLRWTLVPCGSRHETCKRFLEALNHARQWVAILLVDAEAAMTAGPREHLRQQDGWDLEAVREGAVHLMVQVMETWIVADPEALAQYYRHDFNPRKLPRRPDLEREPKIQVLKGLKNATRHTRKGRYNKVGHAGELLGLIDPARVQARCRHCGRLFDELDRIIAEAS